MARLAGRGRAGCRLGVPRGYPAGAAPAGPGSGRGGGAAWAALLIALTLAYRAALPEQPTTAPGYRRIAAAILLGAGLDPRRQAPRGHPHQPRHVGPPLLSEAVGATRCSVCCCAVLLPRETRTLTRAAGGNRTLAPLPISPCCSSRQRRSSLLGRSRVRMERGLGGRDHAEERDHLPGAWTSQRADPVRRLRPRAGLDVESLDLAAPGDAVLHAAGGGDAVQDQIHAIGGPAR